MEAILNFDGSILLWIQEYIRHDFMDWFWTHVTTLGNFGWFWLALSVVLIVFKKTRTVGIVSLCSIALCFIITNLGLKLIVARPRPYIEIPGLHLIIPPESDHSFPSGHTTASFACACILVRMLPKKFGIPAVLLAVIIGFSRLYVGVHYPSDVLAGVLVGLIGSTIVYHIYLYIKEKRHPLENAQVVQENLGTHDN